MINSLINLSDSAAKYRVFYTSFKILSQHACTYTYKYLKFFSIKNQNLYRSIGSLLFLIILLHYKLSLFVTLSKK